MKIIKIDADPYLHKDVRKASFSPEELPFPTLFSKSDVIIGNPSCNIAIGVVYNWKEDVPPPEVREVILKLSNYAALTGYWRTTNGAKYVFSNLCKNPNINTFVLLVFDLKDNGHLVCDAMKKFYTLGVDDKGIIKESESPNPRFEQVPPEAFDRVRQQLDLLIIKRITPEQYSLLEDIMKACIQEPAHAVPLKKFQVLDLEFFSPIGKDRLYDDGIRFESPLTYDLTTTSLSGLSPQKSSGLSSVGKSLCASSLEEGLFTLTRTIYAEGDYYLDQRHIGVYELRSVTLSLLTPFQKIPNGFSLEYLERYTSEFLSGKKSEFAYTYHDRIFKHFGDQVEQAVLLLQKTPETRRCLITLWDPREDLGNTSPPCLDFIWCCIRNGALELHVVFRSHHIATITKKGDLIPGEGAFVPNMYAIASLQQKMAEQIHVLCGSIVLTDFSGHIYVQDS